MDTKTMIDSARASLIGIAMLAAAGAVCAGEFNEEGGGFAIKGYDAVAYVKDQRPVKGSESWQTTYKGSKFLFASAANRDAFVAEPERYAPQFGGYCAFGTASGYKVDTKAEAFTVIDGKLYLNYNTRVLEMWSKDRTAKITQAEATWPEVSKLPVGR